MRDKRQIHLTKTFILYTILFEMHTYCKGRYSLQSLLCTIPFFCQYYTLIELANAKLCVRELCNNRFFYIEDPVETFLACCIISRKFWSDRPHNNSDYINLSRIGTVSSINLLERQILCALKYAVGMRECQIKSAIQEELNIDKKYKTSMRTYRAYMRRLPVYTN